MWPKSVELWALMLFTSNFEQLEEPGRKLPDLELNQLFELLLDQE